MPCKQNQPNILFIMADQQRFDYLSCTGADFVKTPNIDRIAPMGMQFTHSFINSPLWMGMAMIIQVYHKEENNRRKAG